MGLLRAALVAAVSVRAAVASCAPASLGACHENGYPNPGVNTDADCCAASAGASCAEGYAYTRGEVCYRFDGGDAYETCCERCVDGEDCGDRGPGHTCARPDERICMERGYPKIGDNIDADCCTVEGAGWCAEGYAYVRGDVCYQTDDFKAYSTCCQPCNATGYCDDGPGNDTPPPKIKYVVMMVVLIFFLCAGGVGGVVAIVCCVCRTQNRRAPAGDAPRGGPFAAPGASRGYVPVEMGVVVAHHEPDAGLEMNSLPGSTANPLHAVAGV